MGRGKGLELAKKILDSGKAYKKFLEIIKAQDGNPKKLRFAKYKQDVLSKKEGRILEIDNKKVNELARSAGCPADKKAGLYLHKQIGETIKRGEKIITIYAESKPRMNQAVKASATLNPFVLK